MASSKENVVDFEQALALTAAAPRQQASATEPLALLASHGRMLAHPVLADRDQPAFNRSTRDGFAVRAGDLAQGPLRIAGMLRAGMIWPDPLAAGTALQIMTGAPVPAGADAVLMVEHAAQSEGAITLVAGRTLAAGDNIVPRGAEAHGGDVVMPVGTLLGASEIALAAFCGASELQVFTRPRVAIVSTGDELVDLGEEPGAHQIRNSNSYGLAAMISACGGEPLRLPIARDTAEDTRMRLREARGTVSEPVHLIILSGGVSMGEFDLVEVGLAELDAEFLFTGVRMQPGKPVVFGRLPARDGLPACLFFGLPGNPVSTEVTFHCFAEPLIKALAGAPAAAPRWALATLAEPAAGKPGLTRLLPARLTGTSVALVPWQGSGDLAANARANCYAELLPEVAYVAGEVIRILLR